MLLNVPSIILSIVNILLHFLGCFLLFELRRNGKDNLQQYYLIHFSCCELVGNMLELVCCVLEHVSSRNNILLLRKYFDVINIAGNGSVYYIIISIITLDRLFDILLNIRYPVYWSKKKAKYLMVMMWSAGIIVSIVFCVTFAFGYTDYYNVLFGYYLPILNAIFLVIAVLTYSFIFHKYRVTRPIVKKRRPGVVEKKGTIMSRFTIYRNSRFHIPVLVVSTFVLLKVIPDMIARCIESADSKGVEIMMHICLLSYAVSGIASAYIYVFVQEPVKTLMYKKLNKLRLRSLNDDKGVREGSFGSHTKLCTRDSAQTILETEIDI